MSKTIAILFGLIYVAMGIIGFFDTGLVGPDGFFASNTLYNVVFLVVGAVLLGGAAGRWGATRGTNMIVGAVLALIALTGFLMVPERGEMLGMLVSGSGHWLNLLAGITLIGVSFAERGAVAGMHMPRHATR